MQSTSGFKIADNSLELDDIISDLHDNSPPQMNNKINVPIVPTSNQAKSNPQTTQISSLAQKRVQAKEQQNQIKVSGTTAKLNGCSTSTKPNNNLNNYPAKTPTSKENNSKLLNKGALSSTSSTKQSAATTERTTTSTTAKGQQPSSRYTP